MAPVQSEQDELLLKRVIRALQIAEPYHKAWRKKANHFYSLYRNTQDWRQSYRDSSSPRGKDSVWRDGQKHFGPELFIPLSFKTVETVVPRMLSQRPQMIVRPRHPDASANADNMRYLIEAQQEQIHYELRLQTIAKDGLIYGIGVQKTNWRTDYRRRRRVVPSQNPDRLREDPNALAEIGELAVVFDDPDAVAIDPMDFIPDPFCGEIEEAEFAMHRTWRTARYISQKAQAGVWRNLGELSSENLDAMVDTDKWDEIWRERMKASGRPSRETGREGKLPLHEVIEFHDGEQVITVLDRKLVVQSGENPAWHRELPFQVFRPTQVTHELYGIGEIEPIEQLQHEMNVLRTQRRYNADLVLQRVFAYADGMIEESDLQFGPGYAIPTNGDPRELLFPIPIGDIPHSSYQEEDRISGDVDSTTGISDTVAGTAPSNNTTATGVQLVQQAASARIQNKTTRLELEIIDQGAEQFVALNQQKIRTQRQVRIDITPQPTPGPPEPGSADNRWAWREIGPNALMGEFEISCAQNSTQPENIPQNRADANQQWTLFAENPLVDQSMLVKDTLRKLGQKDPDAWLAPPQPKIPPEVLDILVQSGVPREQVAQALAAAGGPDLSSGQSPNDQAAQEGGGTQFQGQNGRPAPVETPTGG